MSKSMEKKMTEQEVFNEDMNMDHMWEEVLKEQEAYDRYEKQILSEIRKQRGGKFANAVKRDLRDETLNHAHIIGYVEKPQGEPCESDDEKLTKNDRWVYQYQNGGMEGDSYAGYIFIKISEGKYLKYHYTC